MKTNLGYPDRNATMALLAEASIRDRSKTIAPVVTAQVVADMAQLADSVHVDPLVLSYVSEIAENSRAHPHVKLGLSVRGCLALVRVAKTWAAAQGRNYVVPDDVKDLAVPVLCHRILLDAEAEFTGTSVDDVIARIMTAVQPPAERVA